MKRIVLFLAGLAMTSLALAQLSKYKDWAKSPEAYFLTPAEREEWSRVGNDADAEKFIAMYWAKRDPTPATPQNEFKEGVMRRIAAADEQFKLRRYNRGSESFRGRVFVTLGGPSRQSQSRPQDRVGGALGDAGLPTGPEGGSGFGGASTSTVTVNWTYDKDHFDPSWGIPEMRIRFNVDPLRGSDDMAKDAIVDRAMATVAEKSIVNPSGAVGGPPAVAAAPPAASAKPAVPPAATGPAAAAVPPPPAPAAAVLPAASRSMLEALTKEKKDEINPVFWGGSFSSVPGEGFYALQFYVAGDKAPAGPVKFGGVVTSDSGQEAGTYWEDATLADMKTGSRSDKVFERSIVLPPGSYRGAFGLFSADGGTALASASATFRLQAKPADFSLSPLILANTLTPLTKRPGPTDPFVFGVEKPIRVEPKGNKLFAKEDSLWYFYAVWNPKISEPAASPTPAPPPGAPPAPGSAAGAPAPAEAKPRIQARIGVLKDGQPAFAPLTAPAEMQALAPGYYATGSEIPLQTFEPGYYTFTLTVRDLNAPRDSEAFKGIDRKEDFVVLKPDGSIPEKPSPKPAAKKAPAKKG
ncbi:MAG TPA: GWxTD domain-containing protein [Thermoanaerobaculia bacterium]|nr:GWxTD domain-containing protein [Thermoanaerobaculia bacterium]